MNSILPPNRRILLVDDNLSIHDDFRRILVPRNSTVGLDDAAAALFGAEAEPTAVASDVFELDYAQQGQDDDQVDNDEDRLHLISIPQAAAHKGRRPGHARSSVTTDVPASCAGQMRWKVQ